MLKKRRALRHDIRIGDLLLVKIRHPGGKFILPFEMEPRKESDVKGTMITARRVCETGRRSILFFKLYQLPDPELENVKDDQSTNHFDNVDDNVSDPRDEASKTSASVSGRPDNQQQSDDLPDSRLNDSRDTPLWVTEECYVGDSLTPHSGAKFSTLDRDRDMHVQHCAQYARGAFWYHDEGCVTANLNGRYLGPRPKSAMEIGFTWSSWHGLDYSLKRSEMKIRPVMGIDDETLV
ncbi:hypothetical protein NDU88_004081 [Pleurodeles waltl]|uniref:Fibrinogen C-terminal domain-containing protein n=1 Tax=Pleurodeles waltl TaxID=8319 RepID=A0AAV7PEJ8_PLEWA|nr:hypothetical protein NDU88_004081 [Pleurodeles waltl]